MSNKKSETGRGRYTPAKKQRKIVAEFERSGLTQAQFCRERDLHPKTFGRWVKVWRGVKQRGPAATFVEVAAKPTQCAGVEVSLVNGTIIRVETDQSGAESLIAKLVAAAGAPC